jgi:hypothetical protein
LNLKFDNLFQKVWDRVIKIKASSYNLRHITMTVSLIMQFSDFFRDEMKQTSK